MKTLLRILAMSALGAVPAATVIVAQTPAPAAQDTHKPQAPPPDLSDAYYYFSVGHLEEQQFEITGDADRANQAIDAYKKALEITPDSTVVMDRLAEIYAKSQRIRDAVVQAQAVLKLDPDNVDAHKLLARIYVRTLGDVSAGDVQKENLAKAVEQFQAILKIEPDDLYSALWLARLYRFENQHADAEKVLRGVLQRDADNGPALEQLSQILIDEGRSQEAIQLLSDAASDSASPDVYDLLGDAYSQAHESAKAEDAYRKAIAEDPDDPGHLHGLAQALMAQDKYAEALEVFKKLTEIEPATGENFLRMAELYRRLGKFDQAEAALLRAKQLTQGSLEVLWNEALLYEDEGRYDDAIKVLSDAIGGVRGQCSSDGNPNALSVLYEQLGHAYRLAGNDPLRDSRLRGHGQAQPRIRKARADAADQHVPREPRHRQSHRRNEKSARSVAEGCRPHRPALHALRRKTGRRIGNLAFAESASAATTRTKKIYLDLAEVLTAMPEICRGGAGRAKSLGSRKILT